MPLPAAARFTALVDWIQRYVKAPEQRGGSAGSGSGRAAGPAWLSGMQSQLSELSQVRIMWTTGAKLRLSVHCMALPMTCGVRVCPQVNACAAAFSQFLDKLDAKGDAVEQLANLIGSS
jgi:hypothetical protein